MKSLLRIYFIIIGKAANKFKKTKYYSSNKKGEKINLLNKEKNDYFPTKNISLFEKFI